MRFLFKDLMITVSDVSRTRCGVISCALPTVNCGAVTCGITSVIHVDEFDAMKLELDQALEVVRATAEEETDTRLGPRTAEEAAELEEKLTAALREVREARAELEREQS
ncbi:hypothetical protein GCM10010508_48380 [Streptomyces naganishii JCM 4654]|uniref:Uncharacterized protein n=2 Tax=Streptomyces naganishii TaxID=285447 RepID=A0A918Y6S3_9ACTN|nr:hypothetical protein GCM10010508_48380 [Streptomyces naganishii JCM 4654]